MNELDRDTQYHIHCAGGYRSVIFSSILKSRGFNNTIDVAGGYDAIKETDIKLAKEECQLGK